MKVDAKQLARLVAQGYRECFRPQMKRLDALEGRPELKYVGTWKAGAPVHVPGDCVTYDGSVWICKALTEGRPSEDFASWQLAVKRGQDGRDARDAR